MTPSNQDGKRMDDLALMRLAAEAASIDCHDSDDGTLQRRPTLAVTHYVMGQPYGEHEWNPLRDDFDAFRLMVRLHLTVRCYMGNACAQSTVPGGPSCMAEETNLDNPYVATRRAIVRVAAEIARSTAP